MERLWAPWRVEYIRNKDKNKKCVLCFNGVKKKNPEKSFVLVQTPLSYVILNKYPYISGHLMVVPTRHVAMLESLSPEEGIDIFAAIQKTIKILKKTMKPHGINIGLNLGRSSGAGITRHLHYHVVPRWHGDTNFMPVIGQNRVISESLENTFRLLSPHFAK